MRLSDARTLGQIPGATETGHSRHRTTVKIVNFSSEYLPLPYAPRSFAAPGTWAYDPNSLVVLSSAHANRAQATRDLAYTAQSVDVTPKADDLSTAGVGVPPDADITRAIPKDLPQPLVNISRQVTATAESPAEKAAAIQEYLRSGAFTYSTEPAPGSGYKALENFLFTDQKGYCEQFAGAMAMMARIVGIPSRVAVGFLPGVRRGDTWDVTIHNMHAWPELFFAGYGWVRYEPTPASVTGTAPSWTLPGDNRPEASVSGTSSVRASTPAAAPKDVPSADASHLNPGQSVQSGSSWWQNALTGGVGLLVLLILAAPATVRIRRRSGRFSTDAPVEERVESAWAEIRDTVTDYGGSWPDGASPRAIGEEISGRLDGPPSQTMTQVATLVERSRYARTFDDADGTRRLAVMTSEIRRGIAAPQSRWRRIRAFVLPKSLFGRRRRR